MTTLTKTRKFYFMDYTKVIDLTRKIKHFLDSHRHQYAEFHYRQLGTFLKKPLYHQPKTCKLAAGKITFLRSSLINQETLFSIQKCFGVLCDLGFIRHFEFEPIQKQDSFIIKVEFSDLQADFDEVVKNSQYYPLQGTPQQLTPALRTIIANDYTIDYPQILAHCDGQDYHTRVAQLLTVLPDCWQSNYQKMTPTDTFILHMARQLSFLFDVQSQNPQQTSDHFVDDRVEDRVVVFYGLSKKSTVKRDASRMAGYLKSGYQWTDKDTDKGHFIGHSLGGTVDENLFPQKKQINRGLSARGKIYRAMENYCASHEGTFCFSRPIYADFSTRPFVLEYGLLKQDGHWWIEQFDNV